MAWTSQFAGISTQFVPEYRILMQVELFIGCYIMLFDTYQKKSKKSLPVWSISSIISHHPLPVTSRDVLWQVHEALQELPLALQEALTRWDRAGNGYDMVWRYDDFWNSCWTNWWSCTFSWLRSLPPLPSGWGAPVPWVHGRQSLQKKLRAVSTVRIAQDFHPLQIIDFLPQQFWEFVQERYRKVGCSKLHCSRSSSPRQSRFGARIVEAGWQLVGGETLRSLETWKDHEVSWGRQVVGTGDLEPWLLIES